MMTKKSLLVRLCLVAFMAISITACDDLGEDPVSPSNDDSNGNGNDTLTWTGDIFPQIIEPNCVQCHGPALSQNGLNFVQFDDWIAEMSTSGNAYVVAGQPDESELVWRLEGTNGLPRMPQGLAPLPLSEIETVRQWIAQGAVEQ